MLSLYVLFWLMIVLFALIGAMRGWSKEVIAMAGLILSLFVLKTFGWTLVRIVGGVDDVAIAANLPAVMRRQFYLLALIHLVIAFFSYQGVNLIGGRLSGRERLQERLLGMIVGAVNGYLVVGTLWALLEFQVTADGFVPLTSGFPYAFDPLLTRPIAATPGMQLVMTHLPLPWLSGALPIMMVLIFLFVIIVII